MSAPIESKEKDNIEQIEKPSTVSKKEVGVIKTEHDLFGGRRRVEIFQKIYEKFEILKDSKKTKENKKISELFYQMIEEKQDRKAFSEQHTYKHY